MKSFLFLPIPHTGTQFWLGVFAAGGFTLRKAHELRRPDLRDFRLPDTCWWLHPGRPFIENGRDGFQSVWAAKLEHSMPLVLTDRPEQDIRDSWNNREEQQEDLDVHLAARERLAGFADQVIGFGADKDERLARLNTLLEAHLTTDWQPVNQWNG